MKGAVFFLGGDLDYFSFSLLSVEPFIASVTELDEKSERLIRQSLEHLEILLKRKYMLL